MVVQFAPRASRPLRGRLTAAVSGDDRSTPVTPVQSGRGVHHAARRRGGLRSPQYAVEFLKRGKGMPRIVHIAIKVEDLEKATKFYEEVFGFRQTSTGYARGHVSRHLTDGNIDLALMVYDSEDVAEAKLSGSGPCIHHWGIEG